LVYKIGGKKKKMKETNFRIIELPTHLVLLTKDWDNDDEKPTLVITLFNEGVKVNQTYGYDEEEIRDKMFNEITEEQAQNIVNVFVEMMED
jgi:hypothetical protein